ncbi:MAG TPA: DUF3696 domain-containing protein [Fimbriimonadaceae bacterium]|nr:DUF3696 domain-containing protein [Fimbriimonadaceae bacterium]HRJ32490.1 DUF3696 domain-containing protein [Fimbriimonadaceae bacterium]
MLTELHLRNFKSWSDTGSIKLRPLTCFFGSNSSGKTSLIQSILLLKQTAESADRTAVLQFGGPGSFVNLGDFVSVVTSHDLAKEVSIGSVWTLDKQLSLEDASSNAGPPLAQGKEMHFSATVRAANGQGKGLRLEVISLEYQVGGQSFGMNKKSKRDEYDLVASGAGGFQFKRVQGRPWPLPAPTKCYGFPDQVRAYYQNAGFLADIELELENQLRKVYYLGPLRAYPERSYSWGGGQPHDMGRTGELAVDAILAARDRGILISPGFKKKKVRFEEYVARWLKSIGLIESFSIQAVAADSQIYQVRVRKSAGAPEVLITDVGFGVSQILPVIVLALYVPEGSTIILEQPEIHLHPSVQAGLADFLIDATKNRKIQVIVESHSEHFLRRIQRRVAEKVIEPDQTSLYFCTADAGISAIHPLNLNLFGMIENWPKDFFGDLLGEVVATQRAGREARP